MHACVCLVYYRRAGRLKIENSACLGASNEPMMLPVEDPGPSTRASCSGTDDITMPCAARPLRLRERERESEPGNNDASGASGAVY